jgi:hypothetical protein
VFDQSAKANITHDGEQLIVKDNEFHDLGVMDLAFELSR